MENPNSQPNYSATYRILVVIFILLFCGILMVSCKSKPILTNRTPTPVPFYANISLSVESSNFDCPIIKGTTNLPDTTIIMVEVKGVGTNFAGQDKVAVSDNTFQAGPFCPPDGLTTGDYIAKAIMPIGKVQPYNVQQIIGESGEKLAGSQIVHSSDGNIITAQVNFDIVPPKPTILELKGSDFGKTKSHIYRSDTLTLIRAYETDSLWEGWLHSKPDDPDDYLVIEVNFKSLVDSSSLNPDYFKLYGFHEDDFWEMEGLIPYSSVALESGFFIYEKLNKGENYRGLVAFIVPKKANNFILTYLYKCNKYIPPAPKPRELMCSDAILDSSFSFHK